MVTSSAKLLLSDMVLGLDHVPSNYVRPPSERPNLKDVHASDVSIPLIDLQGLLGPSRSDVVKQIGEACQNDGFFQIKNHGISESVVGGMLRLARDFFRLPESERLKNYSDSPSKTVRLSTSFNVKTEKVASWRDFFRLHCHPLEDYVHEWPSNPPSFRYECFCFFFFFFGFIHEFSVKSHHYAHKCAGRKRLSIALVSENWY